MLINNTHIIRSILYIFGPLTGITWNKSFYMFEPQAGSDNIQEVPQTSNARFCPWFRSVDWAKYTIFLSKYISKNTSNIYRHSPKIVKIINNIRPEHTYKIY